MINPKDTLVFDIETNGLLDDVNVIHCVALESNGYKKLFHGEAGVHEALKIMANWEGYLVGHNICSYDIPVIQKLYPRWFYKAQLVDTMLACCILYPEDGILSLETLAERLNLEQQKVQHEDWSVYTDDMGQRCQADVSINVSVLNWLISNTHFDSIVHKALQLEQSVALIHTEQSQYGVQFDIQRARELLALLDMELDVYRQRIMKVGPWKTIIPNTTKKVAEDLRSGHLEHTGIKAHLKKKPGKALEHTVATKNYFDTSVHQVQGDYCKVSFEPFNPDSSDEVRALLLDLGWVPIEWNIKRDKMTGDVRVTSPKLTEESFASLPEGLGRDIATYNTLRHRRSWVLSKDGTGGALNNVRPDGRVASLAFTCGTPTARYRHQGTVCNIPRVTTIYGPEMRELFCVPKGKRQVGVDLEGIEARCLALFLMRGHYTNAKETTALILSPDKSNDFHSFNAIQWGVSRDVAKSVLYALEDQRM